MHRRAGFTLLEICLAIAIGIMLLLIAVPSLQGVLRARRLQAVEERFDDLVRRAQSRSVTERRTYGLLWQRDSLKLVPLERTAEGKPAEDEMLPIAKNEEYLIQRTAALGKQPPGLWTFWRSGVCEPVTITYQGPEGKWSANYDPLTARRLGLTESFD